MDKNLKAEISSLRNEVLANLQAVGQLVEAMDVRLKDDAEVSCLEKCPEIATLLEMCKSVKLHDDTDQAVIQQFNNIVSTIYDKMNAVQLDKYIDILAYTVKAAGINIDENKLIEGLATDHFSELDTKNEKEIRSALLKIKDRIDQISPKKLPVTTNVESTLDASPVPEWASNAVVKDIKAIIKDAAAWDDISQEYFVKMWNATRKHRIDILVEHLDMVINDISDFKYSGEYKIQSLEDVKKLEAAYTRLLQQKTSLIEIISNRSRLDEIKASENDDNFVLFYSWISELFDNINQAFVIDPMLIGDEERNVDNILRSRVLSMLTDAVDRHEKEIYRTSHEWWNVTLELGDVIDASLPIVDKDRVDSFIKVSYNNYTKDLKNAYMWYNSKKSSNAQYTAIIN